MRLAGTSPSMTESDARRSDVSRRVPVATHSLGRDGTRLLNLSTKLERKKLFYIKKTH